MTGEGYRVGADWPCVRSEGPAAGDAGLRRVPVGDVILAEAPAQVHLAPVAFRREVDQAGLDVAQDDPLGRDAFDLGLERPGRVAGLLVLGAAAVAGHDLLHPFG